MRLDDPEYLSQFLQISHVVLAVYEAQGNYDYEVYLPKSYHPFQKDRAFKSFGA